MNQALLQTLHTHAGIQSLEQPDEEGTAVPSQIIIDNHHHPHRRRAETKQLVLSFEADLGFACRQSGPRVREFNHYAVSPSKQILPKGGCTAQSAGQGLVCQDLSPTCCVTFDNSLDLFMSHTPLRDTHAPKYQVLGECWKSHTLEAQGCCPPPRK